jgi:hypothetical protein
MKIAIKKRMKHCTVNLLYLNWGGFFKNELRYDLTHGVAKSDLGRNSKSVF